MSRVWTPEEIEWVRECRAARDSWDEIASAGGYSVAEVKAAFKAATQVAGPFQLPVPQRRRSRVAGYTSRPLLGGRSGTKSALILATVAERARTSSEVAEAVGMPVVNVSAILCGLRAGMKVESRTSAEGRLVWRRMEAQL